MKHSQLTDYFLMKHLPLIARILCLRLILCFDSMRLMRMLYFENSRCSRLMAILTIHLMRKIQMPYFVMKHLINLKRKQLTEMMHLIPMPYSVMILMMPKMLMLYFDLIQCSDLTDLMVMILTKQMFLTQYFDLTRWKDLMAKQNLRLIPMLCFDYFLLTVMIRN
jgi:hypothetical protein